MVVIPIVLGIAAITAAAFYLNAVFAYAIIQPGRPRIRPAFTRSRSHLGVVLGSGFAVGIGLGLSAVVADRWGAGATGAVKAVRMSAKLVSGRNPAGRRDATGFPDAALPGFPRAEGCSF